MKTEDRQKKLEDGQTYNGFTFKGRKHRPITAGSLKFLQRIGSSLYSGNLEECSEIDVIIEYLFATSATPDEMAYAVNHWDEVQFAFGNDYTVKDLADPILVESLTRDFQNQGAASFEVVEETTSKKSMETPVIG